MAFKFMAFAGALMAAQLASTALAQTAAAPTSPPPSAERLRLARAVFEAQGGVANVSVAMDRIMASLQTITPADSPAVAAARTQSREFLQQVLHKYLPQMLDAQAESYAETFDEHQLADILAFYQSPTGQIMREKMPELAERNAAAISKLIPAVIVEVLDHQCGQTTCTAQQQKTLAALKQKLASAPAP